MNANKPVIPREVAEAIEYFRAQPSGNNALILRYLHVSRPEASGRGGVLKRYEIEHGLDTLLAALVNGYEIEKSAEELAHEAIRKSYEARRSLSFASTSESYERGYDEGRRLGIITTLNMLGIKIPGVNAPKEDVK